MCGDCCQSAADGKKLLCKVANTFMGLLPSQTAVTRSLRSYAEKLRLFRYNARLYLLVTVLSGLAFGVFRLLFNFYVLSLGYNEALLGGLLTVASLVSMVSALPAGYVSDRIGRKSALLLSSLTMSTAVLGMVLWPTMLGLYAMNAIMGLAQSLAGVTFGPFLMENSKETERTYLFSFSMGLQTIAGFAGNWLGGHLPTWTGRAIQADPTSAAAYSWALTAVALTSFLAIIPIFFIRRPYKSLNSNGRKSISPFAYARQNPGLLLKLISPMLLTSLGAGLLMPFLNIFFRSAFNSSDSTIGLLFATGSFFMGIGLILAPPLADRYGKMTIVVVSQALSIPFLVLMGFAPWFGVAAAAYLIRLALMNMSNPVYQTFVMEQVDENARATVASLVSMSWNVGWAFSPSLSGWIQVNYGFDPIFMGTIATYVVAIYLYWRFFGRAPRPLPAAVSREP